MRSLLLVAAFCFLAGPARSAEPKGCICGDSCTCKPGVCPGGCPLLVRADAAGHYETRCSTDPFGRKSCVRVWVPDAEPAAPTPATACQSCQAANSTRSTRGFFPLSTVARIVTTPLRVVFRR